MMFQDPAARFIPIRIGNDIKIVGDDMRWALGNENVRFMQHIESNEHRKYAEYMFAQEVFWPGSKRVHLILYLRTAAWHTEYFRFWSINIVDSQPFILSKPTSDQLVIDENSSSRVVDHYSKSFYWGQPISQGAQGRRSAFDYIVNGNAFLKIVECIGPPPICWPQRKEYSIGTTFETIIPDIRKAWHDWMEWLTMGAMTL